jgi:hypothetical protein
MRLRGAAQTQNVCLQKKPHNLIRMRTLSNTITKIYKNIFAEKQNQFFFTPFLRRWIFRVGYWIS